MCVCAGGLVDAVDVGEEEEGNKYGGVRGVNDVTGEYLELSTSADPCLQRSAEVRRVCRVEYVAMHGLE